CPSPDYWVREAHSNRAFARGAAGVDGPQGRFVTSECGRCSATPWRVRSSKCSSTSFSLSLTPLRELTPSADELVLVARLHDPRRRGVGNGHRRRLDLAGVP